jgi:hypothetical protein
LRRAMLTHESRTPQSVVKYGMPASAIPYQATIQLIFGFIVIIFWLIVINIFLRTTKK